MGAFQNSSNFQINEPTFIEFAPSDAPVITGNTYNGRNSGQVITGQNTIYQNVTDEDDSTCTETDSTKVHPQDYVGHSASYTTGIPFYGNRHNRGSALGGGSKLPNPIAMGNVYSGINSGQIISGNNTVYQGVSFSTRHRSSTGHDLFRHTQIPLQRQYQTLDDTFTRSHVFFPDSSHSSLRSTPRHTSTTVNKLTPTNPAQSRAVTSILAAPSGSFPFVVFGPPGTGKTTTIVEAIGKLINNNSKLRILACAPSNSAADLIAERLSENLGTDELFRMYAPSRDEKQVPDLLKPYSYYRNNADSRPCFSVPPIETMKKYRVIVSTLISASIALRAGIPRGHYSHIFIDDAEHATETEAFRAIKTMADPQSTSVVLSGDPNQLGPIIRSSISAQLGLEAVHTEHLMDGMYNVSLGHGKNIVKLVKNFRSHEAILKFPNKKFYENELELLGKRSVINAYLMSSYLPNKNFPVVFHAVSGKDDRAASSPSFFNIDEVIQVKSYIQQLKADSVFKTSDKDIGVISPYHPQCLKIRSVLRGVADNVKVGTVEEFHGQERNVIIISTVRSNKDFIGYDIKNISGFVASPRRFNVSITRAKALLIIIGDPEVLGVDPLWRSFLNYVYANRGWKGPDIPWDPSKPVDQVGGYDTVTRNPAALDINEFTRRMESLKLGEVPDDPDVAGVNHPWRELQ